MVRSSVARITCTCVIAALALSIFPIPLAPETLPQNILPAPILTPILAQVSNVEADAQTLPATTTLATSTPVQKQAQAKPVQETALVSAPTTYPRLVIPSINLNDTIISVGLTSAGAMAVPNGATSNVGWYDGGPQPGQPGSAVLDAHVFAAFAKLNELQAGDSIYVQMSATETLHFVVSKTVDYPLSQITSQDLFTPTSDRDLNLITCAGKLTPDDSTYDHRLVIYTTLVSQ